MMMHISDDRNGLFNVHLSITRGMHNILGPSLSKLITNLKLTCYVTHDVTEVSTQACFCMDIHSLFTGGLKSGFKKSNVYKCVTYYIHIHNHNCQFQSEC